MAEQWSFHSTPRRIGFTLALILCVSALRSTFFDWHHVPTQSMVPNILPGDRIIVSKSFYRVRLPFSSITVLKRNSPERSDVITFLDPDKDLLMVKRVIGIPGDRVEMDDNQLIINGIEASYIGPQNSKDTNLVDSKFSHLREFNETIAEKSHNIAIFSIKPKWSQRSFESKTIPISHYLVLGDNRDDSSDYRTFGLIPEDRIMGKVLSVGISQKI